MKPTLFLCLLTILFSCTAQTDITPVKSDAPDLDFSKAQYVNEFQYDGVFTIYKGHLYVGATGEPYNYEATYNFYGSESKLFKPQNEKNVLGDGFWYDSKTYNYLNNQSFFNLSAIKARVSVNDFELLSLPSTVSFGSPPGIFPLNLESLKYDALSGLTWKISDVIIPDTPDMKQKNNLSAIDAQSFNIAKKGIKVFPNEIVLDPSYRLGRGVQALTIKFEAPKNTDVIYFNFTKTTTLPNVVEPLKPFGVIKYVQKDASSITVSRDELALFLNGGKSVTCVVQAVKHYTAKQGERNFLFKNTTISFATITIE
jgi:hypothetical protein